MDKMRRTQRKAREYLEKQGHFVWMISHTRWSKDIYDGLFDGFSLSERDSTISFLQIKSGSMPKLKPYIQFSETYPFVVVVLMSWVDRKGWNIKEIVNGKVKSYKTWSKK